MSFQNLLLGGPVIVVLEKNIPLESAVCFHQQRMCLWGGGEYIYTKENKCSKHFPVFTVEPVELNDTKYLCR